MCGLFGFQYNPDKLPSWEQRSVVAIMLALEAQTRGRHASGYARWEEDERMMYYDKSNFAYERSGLLPATVGATNLIGHTRYATVGAQIKENAHPFHIGKIIGAHNGAVYNYKELGEKYEERKGYNVDSEHLIAHIAADLPLADMSGYGAVAWYDLRVPGTVFLCRLSGHSDLEAEVLADGIGVVWGSTTTIISSGLSAVQWYTKSKKFHIDPHIVYAIKDGTITPTDRKLEFGTAELRSSKSTKVDTVTVWRKGEWVDQDTGKPACGTAITKSQYVSPYATPTRALQPDLTQSLDEWRKEYTKLPDGSWIRRDQPRTKVSNVVDITDSPLDELLNYDAVFGKEKYICGLSRATITEALDVMTRRERRKIMRIIPNIREHSTMCTCGGCKKVYSTVLGTLQTNDQIG